MTKIFMTSYYILIFSLIYNRCFFILNQENLDHDFILFATVLNILPAIPWLYTAIYILGLFMIGVAILSQHKIAQCAAALSILILITMEFFHGKISSAFHPWLISSVLVCFIRIRKPLNSIRNLFVIRLIQSLLLCSYFISGLWKLRSFHFSTWKMVNLDHIAYAIGEGNGPGPLFRQLIFIENPQLVVYGSIVVMLFQVSSIIPVVSLKYFKVWGIAAVSFHFLTGISLGIWFAPTTVAALFFFVLVEVFLEKEKEYLRIEPFA